MTITDQIAKNLKAFYAGENWTSSDLKSQLSGVTWQQAVTKIDSFNTIASLVYHINYYVVAVSNVLRGTPLESHNKYSFDVPSIQSAEEWDFLVKKVFDDAEVLAGLILQLPEADLWKTFVDKKNGNYYENIAGVIEHNYYHLGQIVILKKMLRQENAK
ncbi:MAG TPA: hypothetical protein VKR32_17935 [Puia sp.]|nr:hypothetical protein [Puia sp.]